MTTKTCLTAAAIALCTNPVFAQTQYASIDLNSAAEIRDHCIAAGKEAGHAVAIAVFDANALLVTFAKSDTASRATGEVAHWKGQSAASYRFTTQATAKWNVPTAPLISTAGGGLPIYSRDGEPLGAVGVSGAPVSFDIRCGAEAIKAAGFLTEAPSSDE